VSPGLKGPRRRSREEKHDFKKQTSNFEE